MVIYSWYLPPATRPFNMYSICVNDIKVERESFNAAKEYLPWPSPNWPLYWLFISYMFKWFSGVKRILHDHSYGSIFSICSIDFQVQNPSMLKKEYCSWGCLPFNWQLQLHLQHIVRFSPAEYLQLWRRIFIGYHCPSRKARCSWCWLGGCQWTFSREVETSWTIVYPKSQIISEFIFAFL